MRRRLVAALAVLIAMVAGGTLLAVDFARHWNREARPDAEIVEVEIPRGASLAAAAARLEAAGVIDSAARFRLAARLLGGDRPVRYGLYAFRKDAGYRRVLAALQKGEVLTLTLAIPEGLPSVLVHERLMAAPRLTGEVDVPAEGSVLPATWDYRPGEARAALLARMQKGMEETLATLWAARTPASAVTTPQEAVILASIVEKETGIPSERRRVAGLYTNRLRAGMKLEADPTVIYPVTQGRPLGRRIRQSELRADTGWNTYLRPGLPKGPIANPGRESLAAVLDPEPHAYLFMVADGSGGHAFARTHAEHRENVERWYALRRARGEM